DVEQPVRQVVQQIERGPQGPPGPPGRDGRDGTGGDLHYRHPQDTPLAVWFVAHNLGKRPAVTVVNSAGEVILSDVEDIDDNSLRIHFAAPFSGTAYCN